MLFEHRRFAVAGVENAEELAEKLTEHSWCCCQGFRLGGHLFLNDSTGPDGAQEFAVIREADHIQVESVTFSWCSQEEALEIIKQAVAGSFTREYAKISSQKIETPEEHKRCVLCA